MTKIILASASLGRRKLLESIGVKFEVMESNVDEEKIVDADPVKMAVARAEAKAEEVAAQFVETRYCASNRDNILIIGADTVGYQGSWVFNKPKSRKEAEEMLMRLSGKTHKYVSGHCVIKFCNERPPAVQGERSSPIGLTRQGVQRELRVAERAVHVHYKNITDYDISSVTFRKLTPADIKFYLDRVDYLKLCGAFKIMASPQNFVIATHGSISNIIGLSLERLIPVLKQINTDV